LETVSNHLLGPAAMADGTGFYINKTWLNKLGLEIPSTTEELFDILVAFRDNDPNGNNKKDEIPLAIDINTTWANGAINAWFGTGLNENIIIIDEKVYYSPIMDEYKTYVKYLNRLWKAELLDQELFTQDAATFSAKAKLEPNIYGSFMHYREGQILADGNKNYELVLPLDGGTGRYGAIKSIYKEMSAALNMAAITKSAKNPEILARWFDVFMDPYYGQQIIKGPVGTLLEETPDGLLKFVDEIPPQYKNQIEWQNAARLQLLPSLCSQKYNAWFDDNDPILIELAARKKAYGPYYFNDVMPLGFPTKSETEVRVKYGTDLSKYAKEMFALWVTGERDINADWDGYKKQMENLYVNEYMESFQTMYDRLK
jgi:putative aldouronate transport system substrate-binding protein